MKVALAILAGVVAIAAALYLRRKRGGSIPLTAPSAVGGVGASQPPVVSSPTGSSAPSPTPSGPWAGKPPEPPPPSNPTPEPAPIAVRKAALRVVGTVGG